MKLIQATVQIVVFILAMPLMFIAGYGIYCAEKKNVFNRLTGNHVSQWDAMFVDLTIVETIAPRQIPQLDPAPTGNLNSPTRLRPR